MSRSMGSASTHPPTCYHLHEYPPSMGQVFPSHLWGLYDLLDTPRVDFLAAQLHLHDSTLPRPLLHQSRDPPTIRSEYVALQPHLVPSPPPDRLYVCRTTSLSFNTCVCRATSPSVIPPAPTVCLSPRKSVALSVHPTDSLSVIPARPSPEPSVHPPVTPSMTRPSATPPVSLAQRQSDRPSPSDRLYTILPRLSGCPTSHRLHDTPTSPSDHPPLSQRLYDNPPVRQTIRPYVRHSPQFTIPTTRTTP